MQILFLAPIAERAGLTSVALGLTRALQRAHINVGYLKPIAREVLNLPVPEPLTRAYVEGRLGASDADTLLEEVVNLTAQAAQAHDVLVVEGLALDGRNPYASALNSTLSRTLGASALLVGSLDGLTMQEITDQLEIAARDYSRGEGSVAGCLLNFAPPSPDRKAIEARLSRVSAALTHQHLPLVGLIPAEPRLTEPRTWDVAQALGAQALNPGEWRERRVNRTVLSARSAPHVADLLKPGALVVTPGDRDDIIMAASLAHLSGTPLAGLLLTAGEPPNPGIARLCASALNSTLPVLLVNTNSFGTAASLARMDRQVPFDDFERLERTLEFIADHLDVGALPAPLPERGSRRLSPPAFRHELIQRARAANKRIVLPEGDEPRTLHAAVTCHRKGIARCVLLAQPAAVHAVAQAQGLTLPPDLEIIDPDAVRSRYVQPLVELRKHKGLTAPVAEQQLEDNVVLGTVMLACGEVDGLVSGAVHTTASTVRPALQLIKTAPDSDLVSSVFFMLMPDEVLVYGDCAINPDPTAEELAGIAVQCGQSAAAFGIEPRVAMISYSTGASGSGQGVEKVARATQLVRERRPDLLIDGPLQYDAASIASVGAQKAPGSPVAGRATVFVFPDLNTGNTTYKAVQRSAHVVSIGPMLQGLRKPVNDLSRGALVDDIIFTIALTAIQAAQLALPDRELASS